MIYLLRKAKPNKLQKETEEYNYNKPFKNYIKNETNITINFN